MKAIELMSIEIEICFHFNAVVVCSAAHIMLYIVSDLHERCECECIDVCIFVLSTLNAFLSFFISILSFSSGFMIKAILLIWGMMLVLYLLVGGA